MPEVRCNPCCSICAGLILIVVAPFVIWNTEGDYVKTLKALDAAGKLSKQPCSYHSDGSCNECNLDNLKDGDLVFLACQFSNMRDLTMVRKDNSFGVEALRPAIGGSDPAVAFRWTAEMYQWSQTRTDKDPYTMTFDISDCAAASPYDDENDADQTKRRKVCCNEGQPGYRRWYNQHYGRGKTCGAYVGGPKPPEEALLTEMLELSATEVTGDEEEDPDNLEYESATVRRMRGSSDDSRRRRTTAFSCSFPCYDWQLNWSSTVQPDPKTWKQVPTQISEVGYLASPATNLQLPFAKTQSYLTAAPNNEDLVKMGKITLENFQPVTDQLSYITARLNSDLAKMGLDDLEMVQKKKEVWQGLNYTSYIRNVAWTATETSPNNNCLVSRWDKGAYVVGDLRICFERASITKASVIGAVKMSSGSASLIVSPDHLRADTKMRNQDQGFRLRKDQIMSLDQLLAEEKKSNEMALYAGRILGPLILWLAFYCFLQPIVWLVDKMGDTLDNIPCVGGCLGLLADFVETLVGILICIVSCCLGLGCGLFAMAMAWLYYRPLIGSVLLLLSLAFFAAVGYYAYSTRDPNKPRSSVRQSTVGAAVELRGQTVQPAAAPAVAQAMPPMVVTCPEGCQPGAQILVSTPDGRQLQVQVPAGVAPGQTFQVPA